MKILLDECVTKKLKRHLSEFDVKTVVEMEWSGLKNGRLLSAAIDQDFDILLTIDKNIGYQQNMGNFKIAVVIFDTERSTIEHLVGFLPEFKVSADGYGKGIVHTIQRTNARSEFEN